MIRLSEAERVEAWVKEAVDGGAKLVAGGERKGSVITPAILTATKPGMKVRDEEVFGPVVAIEPYDDFEEALAEVNHSKYGLQAGLLTRDSGPHSYRLSRAGSGRADCGRHADLASGPDALWRREGFRAGTRGHSLGDRRDDRAAHAGDGVTGLERFLSDSISKPLH